VHVGVEKRRVFRIVDGGEQSASTLSIVSLSRNAWVKLRVSPAVANFFFPMLNAEEASVGYPPGSERRGELRKLVGVKRRPLP